MFIIGLLIATIFLIVFIVYGNKRTDSENKPHINIVAQYISGINGVNDKYNCIISTLENHMLIEIKKKKIKIELNYNNIISIENKSETKQRITTQSKSPVARGVVGGLVGGAPGLVLGGMSGLNSKVETEETTTNYIHIKYNTSEGETTIILKCECTGIAKYINKKIENDIENTTIKL